MFKLRSSRKRSSVRLELELLEDRITPTTVGTRYTGITDGNAYMYEIPHTYVPSAIMTMPNGNTYQVTLNPLTVTTSPSNTWRNGVAQDELGTNWDFTYTPSSHDDGRTITVDSYDAYANAFRGMTGQNGPQVGGMIDMVTNVTPGNGQTIGWVQVYWTNCDGPNWDITPYTVSAVDNAANPSSPLYLNGAHDQRGFFDAAGRAPAVVTSTVTFTAEVYLVAVTGNSVTVYPDGVQWGWTVTPMTNMPANVMLASSTNPSTTANRTTLTATVTPGAFPDVPVPTGTVTFVDTGDGPLAPRNVLGSAPLQPMGINGAAQATLPNINFGQRGDHNLLAIYNGDSANNGGVGTLLQTVNFALSQLNLNGPGMALPGQPVTITASVSGMDPGGPIPTGSVSFTCGGVSLGSAPLVNGQASFTTSSLPEGTDVITAAYNGDSTYSTATGSMTVTVNRSSVIVMTNIPGSVEAGQTFTLAATVMAGGNPIPTGTVTFTLIDAYGNETQLGAETVNGSGYTSITASVATPGSYHVRVTYSGDADYFAASTTLDLNVYSTQPPLM